MQVKGRKYQALIVPFCILLILSLDQYLKAMVHLRLDVGDSIPVINNILHITYVTNTGAAFGLFKSNTLVFILIAIVAILFTSTLILRSLRKGEFLLRPLFNIGLILIVSGAIGNLIDRLRFGYVIDFIDVRIWPVFNIADASITTGTFLLILSFVLSQKQRAASIVTIF